MVELLDRPFTSTVAPWRGADAAALSDRFEGGGTRAMLKALLEENRGRRIALVSSFGAGSAVLLHLVAGLDPALPVLFVDTGKLFPATLRYRDALVDQLGLTDVRSVRAPAAELAVRDPGGALWMGDTKACCAVRKVEPLDAALAGFDIWLSGRKRHQGATRASLPLVEADGPRLKVNPLAAWTRGDMDVWRAAFDLPQHPLVAQGFPSIGCQPCTSPVAPGEDERAGRWRGQARTECGIHRPVQA